MGNLKNFLDGFLRDCEISRMFRVCEEHKRRECYKYRPFLNSASFKIFFSMINYESWNVYKQYRYSINCLFAIVIIFTICVSSISAVENLSVPAEFITKLSTPGSNNEILRPIAIFKDLINGEIYVADPGNNRIVIFDKNSTYRFEFSGSDYFSIPYDIVVGSEGHIYILGSTQTGKKLFTFDFDGLLISSYDLPDTMDSKPVNFSNMEIDNHDRIYLYDQLYHRLVVYDSHGNYSHCFNIFKTEDENELKELIVGSFSIKDEKIYFPISTLGTVEVFTIEGKLITGFGMKGNQVGFLNFPIAVEVTDDGLILVLDKHRFNVLCYSSGYKFLGEFGGKGDAPGWFYHPTLLEVKNNNEVYIGQIFQNKIQLCRIPEFILAKNVNEMNFSKEVSRAN